MEKAQEQEIINYCTFNQDQRQKPSMTQIAASRWARAWGSRSYRSTLSVFFTASVPPSLTRLEGAAVNIVEMLYSTNIIAVVGTNERAIFTPRRLTVWDTNSQTSRADFSFNSPINYVKMNKQR